MRSEIELNDYVHGNGINFYNECFWKGSDTAEPVKRVKGISENLIKITVTFRGRAKPAGRKPIFCSSVRGAIFKEASVFDRSGVLSLFAGKYYDEIQLRKKKRNCNIWQTIGKSRSAQSSIK